MLPIWIHMTQLEACIYKSQMPKVEWVLHFSNSNAVSLGWTMDIPNDQEISRSSEGMYNPEQFETVCDHFLIINPSLGMDHKILGAIRIDSIAMLV